VHFVPSAPSADGSDTATVLPRPGDVVTTRITHGAPHHLIADGPPLEVRRTRAGDAWESRKDAAATAVLSAAASAASAPAPVLLGMPARRA
jgi:tRNA-2-methylthio-N6-dimethylallyladenosine synthase